MVIERVSSTPTPSMSHEVLYIGSAVPLETSEGLEAVQQPLRSRYPVDHEDSIQGVLARLTVLPVGLQLRFHDDTTHVILFPFSRLSTCAAVRCVKTTNVATGETSARFVTLSSPEAGGANASRPAIFTCITRRTKGRQVLECHGFVCNTPKDALELVQWTAGMDKRSKESPSSFATDTGSNFASMSRGVGVVSSNATHGVQQHRYDGDMSFRASETSSMRDFPVTLKPGEPVISSAVAPGFYNEPSPDGYFYATKNMQVKRYSLQKFHGSSGADDTPSVIGVGNDHFVRSPGYAASQISASGGSHLHHQRASLQQQRASYYPAGPIPVGVRPAAPPMMVPVRPGRPGVAPPMVRPVLVAPPPAAPGAPVYIMPRLPPPPQSARFFSPPPTGVRARPIPVFVGPPPGEFATLPRSHRFDGKHGKGNRTRDSSSSSSSSSSNRSFKDGDIPKINGEKSRKTKKDKRREPNNNQILTDDDWSPRPTTPPTDYEGAPRGPRVSRHDEFYMRERNGFPAHPGSGMYMMPPYLYPPYPYTRAKSQPPLSRTTSAKKDKKSKKNKSGKKSKSHKSKKNGDSHDHHGHHEDHFNTHFENATVYHPATMNGSKANAENRVPRDFRRAENQFQHERAFSKSLAEETRKSAGGVSDPNNAYFLNHMSDGDPGASPGAAPPLGADPFTMY